MVSFFPKCFLLLQAQHQPKTNEGVKMHSRVDHIILNIENILALSKTSPGPMHIIESLSLYLTEFVLKL